MPDWRSTMTRTYEYYTVDPGTWRDVKKLDMVVSSSITRDSDAETLGSASFDVTDHLGECYVRIYMVTIQNGVREKTPMGTYLIQTPASRFTGMLLSTTIDAYTPLLELKEKYPPLGYSLLKGDNIMEAAYRLIRENARAPVVQITCDKTLSKDFIANTDDTWLSFITDLIYNAGYELELDELGRILFAPIRKNAALQPMWTYDDGNSSILYPDIDFDHDLYGIPNVVEVVYTDQDTGETIYVKSINDNPNSPTSTVSRGRVIPYRDTNPSLSGVPNKTILQKYADQLLESLSSVEYTVSYTHAYCPVRRNDCVRLDYKRAGFRNVKARVIRQTINCEPECPVQETAVFTKNLWG